MSDSKTVDVNTDNLDDFSELLLGTAKPAETEAEIEETPETPSATDDSSEESDPEESAEPEEANGDDTPDTEDEDPEEDEPKEAPKSKGRKPAGERIKELTARAYEAERRADAVERELEKLRAPKDAPADPVQRADPIDPDAPHPDTILENGDPKYPLGEFDPTFIRDLTRHTIQQENETIRKADETRRANEDQDKAEKALLNAWTEKVTKAAERLPDLAEKVVELESSFTDIDPGFGQYLAATIMSLDYGPDVLDYLADHPDEARAIVAAGPTRATIALGRLEARFIAAEDSDEEVEKGKIVSSAPPPPPKPNKGSGGRTVSADTDDLDAFAKQFFK